MKLYPNSFTQSHVDVPIQRGLQPVPQANSSLLKGARRHRITLDPRRGSDSKPSGTKPCPPAICPESRPHFRENLIRHAKREAQALAATTPFPDLFLPCLTEEKLHETKRYTQRQERLWDQSQNILARAA